MSPRRGTVAWVPALALLGRDDRGVRVGCTMTTIARIDTIRLDIPFGDHYDGPRAKPRGWTQRDVLLVRVETADGIVGWGEAFGYACATATEAAVRDRKSTRLNSSH